MSFPAYLTSAVQHVSLTNFTLGVDLGFQGIFWLARPASPSPRKSLPKEHYLEVGANYYILVDGRNWSQTNVPLKDGPTFNPAGLQVRLSHGFL